MNSEIKKLSNGRYTVGQMIGTGGMADVYLGKDTRLDCDGVGQRDNT